MRFSTPLELHSPFDFAQGLFDTSIPLSASPLGAYGQLRMYDPLRTSEISLSLPAMIPDYPHKHFSDKRNRYSLLMLTLAMDSVG